MTGRATVEVGRHTVVFEPPDTLRWNLVGGVDLPDAKALVDANSQIGKNAKFLLVDLQESMDVSAEAREFWSKNNANNGGAAQLITCAYGGALTVRVVARAISASLMLVPGRSARPQVKFFADEAAALAWITAQREAPSSRTR